MKTAKFIGKALIITGILSAFYFTNLFAQGASPGAPHGGKGGASGGAPYGGGSGGENVPIDGGAALLLAAGAAYGIKKIKDHRENNKEPQI